MTSSVMQRNWNWNPDECFGFTPQLSCPGVAHSKADKKCTRSSAIALRERGERILNEIGHLDPRSEAWNIVLLLAELARCLLCSRNHIGQANEIVSKWIYKMVTAHRNPNPVRYIRRIQSANQHPTQVTVQSTRQITATLRANQANHATELAALNIQILELQSQNTRLSEICTTLEAQLAETRNTLKTQLAETRNTLETQLAETRNRLEAQLAVTRNTLETQLGETKTEVVQYNVRSASFVSSYYQESVMKEAS